MDKLINSPFFRMTSQGDNLADIPCLYEAFVNQLFNICHQSSQKYGEIFFTLHHTSIELASLHHTLSADSKKK